MNAKHSFTDDNYFSKNELKNKLENIKFSHCWEEVFHYRQHYAFILPSKFRDDKNVFIVQTPWILQKEIALMQQVNLFYTNLIELIGEKYNAKVVNDEINNWGFFKDLKYIVKNRMNLEIKDLTLESIVFDEQIDLSDLEEIKALEIKNIMQKLYYDFLGPEIILKKIFPTNISQDKLANVTTNINQALYYKNLNSYITKSAIIYFQINQNVENDHVDLISGMLIQSYLFQTSFKAFISAADFIDEYIEWIPRFNRAYLDTVREDGDITYLYLEFIAFFSLLEKKTLKVITKYINKVHKNVDLSRKLKNVDLMKMMKLYPLLSKNQILFFLNHRDNLESYTVENFKVEMETSYETARYSMDKLATTGLYIKIKTGKKYVFKTI